jgi:hypothetical protein
MAVPPDLDRRVRERAKGVCEYCKLPQSAYRLTFQIDHIWNYEYRHIPRPMWPWDEIAQWQPRAVIRSEPL